MKIYEHILEAISQNKKLLAVLIDPDKMQVENVRAFISKVNTIKTDYLFVGGSMVEEKVTDAIVSEIKKFTKLPVIIFPGDVTQITNKADALLFLSLISGRNPDYLIGKHVEAISRLKNTNLEVIPSGYILIENGKRTSVEKVSDTTPMARENIQLIVDTAKAGELLGMKLIYLEAGSGALHPVSEEIIKSVKQELTVPLIVGGGIRTLDKLESAYQTGADLIVIGTAFEKDESFFDNLCS